MRRLIYAIIVLCTAGCASVKPAGITARTFKTASGWQLPYNIFYPENYGKEKVPLLLWLHGAGERGDDNVSQLIHIVPYVASDIVQSKFKCIVVAPQCPKEDYWAPIKRTEWRIINDGKVTPAMDGVIQLLDKLLHDPSIDKSRIYVGGLSMGGFGALDLLSRRPELFAAAVPICGGADLNKVSKYKDVPLWIFHGAKDMVVPVDLSRDLIKALRELGSNPKYTEYPEGGHGVWNDAIRDPELLPWLFGQKK
ncbi:MAG: prolyl oligopeptidase family serine peptidase [Saprospiraceae bacterium]